MDAVGRMPKDISLIHALNSIGENVIVADLDYTITWMNVNAVKLFKQIAPLYDIEQVSDMIGMNMNRFHRNPAHQEYIMKNLDEVHKTRIVIRDTLVTDIIITPIKGSDGIAEGYVIMLQDVTTRAEEERRNEKLIAELSVPILHIWDNTIALPLVGSFTEDRGKALVSKVLEECTEKNTEYVLLALNGLDEYDDALQYSIRYLYDCLKLVGTECIIVGITPKLAMTFGEVDKNISTFSTAHQGLHYIISQSAK
ncbi:RsbR, positive regulator of sigma-B [Alkalicoccus daliensis]|uniref:Anti-anti-sigma regulatory factor (Antagonist of anti-sigma factor) n=1 Tax=Alkalicoccus daliensis TaxID=745820 RepID=A0A1H0JL71_9BACI|nr:RsbR, positive regulator of sigma-B [Alkalicoccus daliensis]SDO44364.1 Anti-anti-sigma regulatory factor (antagonist of anti-sigma factor) [Alkalicoccus daliensis]